MKQYYFDKKFIDKFTLVCFCTALTIMTYAVLGLKFSFYLSTNDDIMLHNLMSGAYTGTPESHLIYIMHPLGVIFSSLYRLNSTIDWYEIFASYGHYLCILLCSYRVGSLYKKNSSRLIAAFMTFASIIAIDINYIYSYQYTVFAGVLVTTGLLWIVTASTPCVKDIAVSITFLTLSMWLRKEVFLLSLPLVGIIILFRICNCEFSITIFTNNLRKWLPCILALFIAVMFSLVENKLAYSSDSWKEFATFNEARTAVYDYTGLPDYEANIDLYDDLGISVSEYIALRQYDIELLDNIDADTLSALAQRQRDLLKDWEQYYSVPRKIIGDVIKYYLLPNASIYNYLFIIVALLVMCGLIRKKSYISLAASLLTCGYTVSASAYLIYKGRFPERVSYPLILFSLIALIGFNLLNQAETDGKTFLKYITTALYLIVVLGISTYQFRIALETLDINVIASAGWVEVNEYMSSRPDTIFLLDTGIYANSAEKMSISQSRSIESSNSYKLSSWIINSELQKKRIMKVFGSELIKVSGENIAYVIPDGIDTEWLKEILGVDCVIQSDEIGSEYNIYTVE